MLNSIAQEAASLWFYRQSCGIQVSSGLPSGKTHHSPLIIQEMHFLPGTQNYMSRKYLNYMPTQTHHHLPKVRGWKLFWVANKDTSAVQSLIVCFGFVFFLALPCYKRVLVSQTRRRAPCRVCYGWLGTSGKESSLTEAFMLHYRANSL